VSKPRIKNRAAPAAGRVEAVGPTQVLIKTKTFQERISRVCLFRVFAVCQPNGWRSARCRGWVACAAVSRTRFHDSAKDDVAARCPYPEQIDAYRARDCPGPRPLAVDAAPVDGLCSGLCTCRCPDSPWQCRHRERRRRRQCGPAAREGRRGRGAIHSRFRNVLSRYIAVATSHPDALRGTRRQPRRRSSFAASFG